MRWLFWRSTLTEDDKAKTDLAEQDLEHRKERGAAIHAEVSHIVERNHLAEKFHEAFTVMRKKT